MIYFHRVSRDLVDEKRGRRTGFLSATASLPGNMNLAVLGQDPDLLTLFLHLVAGSEVPDRGKVVVDGIRLSPIINAGGVPGSSLVPQLSALNNIRFFARLHGIDAMSLVRTVESACRFGSLLNVPVRKFDGAMRRALDAVLIAALPYDCYVVDRLDALAPDLRWLIAHSAQVRKAGMIFTTDNLRMAKQFGSMGVVIQGGTVRMLPELDEALASASDG